MTEAKSQNLASWKNPYVADGLVAMWDGEWNAGPGSHSETSQTWTDVVSGRESNPVKNWHAVWTEKSLHVPLHVGSYADNDLISPFGDFGDRQLTWEICLNSREVYVDPRIGKPLYLFGEKGNEGSSVVSGRTDDGARLSIQIFSVWMPVLVQSGDVKTTESARGTVSLRFDAQDIAHTQRAFFNGKDTKQGWPYAHNPVPKDPRFRMSCSGAEHDFEIYCVRMYGKMLSDDEIAHNYEIDKKRFMT